MQYPTLDEFIESMKTQNKLVQHTPLKSRDFIANDQYSLLNFTKKHKNQPSNANAQVTAVKGPEKIKREQACQCSPQMISTGNQTHIFQMSVMTQTINNNCFDASTQTEEPVKENIVSEEPPRRRQSRINQIRSKKLTIEIDSEYEFNDQEDLIESKFLMDKIYLKNDEIYTKLKELSKFEEVFNFLKFLSNQVQSGMQDIVSEDELLLRVKLMMDLYSDVIRQISTAFKDIEMSPSNFVIPDEAEFQAVEDKMREQPQLDLKKSLSVQMSDYLEQDEIDDMIEDMAEVVPPERKKKKSQTCKLEEQLKSTVLHHAMTLQSAQSDSFMDEDDDLPNLLD